MSFKDKFLDGFRAARNGQSPRTEFPPEQPWEPPQWESDAWQPQPSSEAVACAACEAGARDLAAREAELAECRSVIAELWEKNEANKQRIDALTAEVGQVTATRDRYQANGIRIAGEMKELKSAFELPGVLKAARKAALVATHPDRGKTESERRTLTEHSQKVTALFDRMEKAP